MQMKQKQVNMYTAGQASWWLLKRLSLRLWYGEICMVFDGFYKDTVHTDVLAFFLSLSNELCQVCELFLCC